MVKKIALVGTSEGSTKLADELDESWEVWGCNATYQMISGVDLHFEMHDIGYLQNLGITDEYVEFMKFKGNNLILNNYYPEFPEARRYPIEEICARFNIKYFNNTIAYMAALALMNEDLEDLALLGIDMAASTEYAHQRPCLEYYLGWASARGIRLTIPDICPILKTTHLYGIEKPPAYVHTARKRRAELEALSGRYDKELKITLVNDAYARGLRDENKIMGQLFP